MSLQRVFVNMLNDNIFTLIFMFDNALYESPFGCTNVMINSALKSGSSKHGNALLAYVGSNLEVAIILKK
jgi:hypothetical protein